MNTSINKDVDVVANLQRRDIYNKYQQKKNSIQEIDHPGKSSFSSSFFFYPLKLLLVSDYQYIGLNSCQSTNDAIK